MPASLLDPTLDPLLLARIEDAGLNASAPPQQRWLDGWLLRVSNGKAKRARCINALAAGRLPLSERLVAATRLYAAAKLPLIVRITPFTLPTTLDAWLAAEGLQRFDDTRVMYRPLAEIPPAMPLGDRIGIQRTGLEAFAQRVGGFRDSPLAHRQAHAERLLSSPVASFAFELTADRAVAACGQFALDGDLAGLYDIYTAVAARSRGHAHTLCAHLLAEARRRGARHAYLQVESDNHAARSVYRRLGFSDAYTYHYRAREPAAA